MNTDYELLSQKGTLGVLHHISHSFSSKKKKGRQSEEYKDKLFFTNKVSQKIIGNFLLL